MARIICGFVLFIISIMLHAYGNESIYLTGGVSLNSTLIQNNSQYLVQISSSNSLGQSVNVLTQESFNKDVQFINSSSLNPNQRQGAEATTIIIDLRANDGIGSIQLTGLFSLVGKPAELVVVSSSEVLSCTSCSFKGFSKVSFIKGKPTLENGRVTGFDVDGTVQFLGKVGLSGVSVLDIVAQDIQFSDSELSTSYSLDGSGQIVPFGIAGNQVIASGVVRLMAGIGHYELIKGVMDNVHVSKFGNISLSKYSSLNSANVHISNTSAIGTIDILGTIRTTADVFNVAQSKGKNIVPKGSVSITSYSDANVAGKIFASGNIELSALGDISIDTLELIPDDVCGTWKGAHTKYGNAEIKGQHIEITAGERLLNFGQIKGASTSIVAKEVSNEGVLWSEGDSYLEAKELFKNQFGGIIHGEKISLVSNSFYNGSVRPYRLVQNELCQNRSRSTPVFTRGTYHVIGDDPEDHSAVPVITTASIISGTDVEVRADVVTNVNPYFIVHTDSDYGMNLDPSKVSEIVITATRNLTIKSTSLVNSSAIIEARYGVLALDNANFINERYRVQVNQGLGTLTEQDLCNGITNCTTSALDAQYVYATSPAGRIYAGNNAVFISRDTFKNTFSFIEVFGDANVDANYVVQSGLNLQYTVNVTETEHHKQWRCTHSLFGRCLRGYHRRWTTETSYIQKLSSGQIPSLFSVSGYLRGKGAGSFNLSVININFI